MSKMARLKEHLNALEDIDNIMKAMKNHALFQINNMTRYLSTHEKSIKTIQEVGNDFFGFYPLSLKFVKRNESAVIILIGSERGFCGSFNDEIINKLNEFEKEHSHMQLKLIVVGRKLSLRLSNDKRIIREISGYETAEEIPGVISNLIYTMEDIFLKLNIQPNPLMWQFFFNENDNNKIETKIFQPLSEFSKVSNTHFSFKPILNLSTEQFLLDYIDHYLLSFLNFIFYRSFMIENYQRVNHLENALNRLKSHKEKLVQHLNLVRQEEITQEIEVIMLSVQAIANEFI